jgi:hypothetical protein
LTSVVNGELCHSSTGDVVKNIEKLAIFIIVAETTIMAKIFAIFVILVFYHCDEHGNWREWQTSPFPILARVVKILPKVDGQNGDDFTRKSGTQPHF